MGDSLGTVTNLQYSEPLMAISEQPASPDARRAEPQPTRRAVSLAGVVRPRARWIEIAERLSVAVGRLMHPFGAHRWRDGYTVDVERGWTQYRGSRCTICDAPWEGW
jgi:hypothetical protein